MTLLFLAALLLSPQDDLKQLQAVFETSAGNFIIEFYADQAPNHARQFTAFGHVVDGIEVVDKISTTPVDDKQIARDRIEIRDVVVRSRPAPVPLPFSEETVEELSRYRVVMDTSKGKIVIEMLADK